MWRAFGIIPMAGAVLLSPAAKADVVEDFTIIGTMTHDRGESGVSAEPASISGRVETALSVVKSLTRAKVDGAESKIIAWKGGADALSNLRALCSFCDGVRHGQRRPRKLVSSIPTGEFEQVLNKRAIL